MTYAYGAIARRLAGAKVQLGISIPANLGYRFYAHHLNRYYTCDWSLPEGEGAPHPALRATLSPQPGRGA
jgi:hypothetical protein